MISSFELIVEIEFVSIFKKYLASSEYHIYATEKSGRRKKSDQKRYYTNNTVTSLKCKHSRNEWSNDDSDDGYL